MNDASRDAYINRLVEDKTKKNSGLFDNDDLEDILIKAVSLQYDTNLKHHPGSLSAPVKCKLSDCLSELRSVGVSVSPENRLLLRNDWIDTRVDSFPDAACFFDYWSEQKDEYGEDPSLVPRGWTQDRHKDHKYYASAYFIKRINRIPPFWRCDGVPQYHYWLYSYRTGEKIYDIWRTFGAFDADGKPLITYYMDKIYDDRNYRGSSLIKRYGKTKEYFSEVVSLVIQQYNDNQYLWNVSAIEGDAKINVACYKENIKSLFYARQLPVTETGRKRPILHWVRAHKRRLKEGVDIDIQKYLRGVTEIEMDKTKFIISSPRRDVGL